MLNFPGGMFPDLPTSALFTHQDSRDCINYTTCKLVATALLLSDRWPLHPSWASDSPVHVYVCYTAATGGLQWIHKSIVVYSGGIARGLVQLYLSVNWFVGLSISINWPGSCRHCPIFCVLYYSLSALNQYILCSNYARFKILTWLYCSITDTSCQLQYCFSLKEFFYTDNSLFAVVEDGCIVSINFSQLVQCRPAGGQDLQPQLGSLVTHISVLQSLE